MAVVKDARVGELTRDAIVLDLGDLRRQGDVIRAKATEDATRIIQRAEVEAMKLVAEAKKRGYTEGHAAGREQGLAAGHDEGRHEAFEEAGEQLRGLIASWAEALDVFVNQRDQMLRDARHDVVQLAVKIGELIIKDRVEHDAGAAVRQLEDALSLIMEPTTLRIEVSAADDALVSEALPGLLAAMATSPHTDVLANSAVERGGCVVRTGAGAIDARIGEQIRRLTAALLPAGPSPRWPEPGESVSTNNDAPPADPPAAEPTDPGGDPA